MVKRTATRRVDRSQAANYAEAGRVFLASAQALSDVADEGAPYGNAIALLAIHASISYTDALSIAYGERKSTDDHARAIDTLRSILGPRLPPGRAKQLGKVLLEKDTVSYQGSYYTIEDGRRILHTAELYCRWARELFEERPTV
ncbi:MAG: hypothetical protein WKF55_10780 [Gemmatimonadaceae bacterium]